MIKSNMRPYQKSAVQYRLHGGFFSFDHNNKTGKYRILGMDDTDRGISIENRRRRPARPICADSQHWRRKLGAEKNENGEHSGGGGRHENVLVFLFGMENRNHAELRCTGGLPFLSTFLPCLKKRGPGTTEKFAMEFVRILFGEETEKAVSTEAARYKGLRAPQRGFGVIIFTRMI